MYILFFALLYMHSNKKNHPHFFTLCTKKKKSFLLYISHILGSDFMLRRHKMLLFIYPIHPFNY